MLYITRLLAYLRALLASYTATLPDEALLEAAEAGKLEGVLEALRLGADISAETSDGWTALHFAAAQGRVDVARALLDAGANVSADTTSVRRTPLHWAARNGRTETVHLLLRRGAQTASRDTEGSAPLHLAAARAEGNAEVARLLLEVGADVAAKRKARPPPCAHAVRGPARARRLCGAGKRNARLPPYFRRIPARAATPRAARHGRSAESRRPNPLFSRARRVASRRCTSPAA